MDTERVRELFEQYIYGQGQVEDCEEAFVFWEKNNPVPERPTRVETLEEWRAYEEAFADWKHYDATARRDLSDAALDLKSISEELLRVLPNEVWFCYAGWAFGVAVTNWGGNYRYFRVRKWSDDLPSLDERYHGD